MKNHGAISVTRGIPDDLRGHVSRLFWRHFGHHILPFPVSEARGAALVRRGLQPDCAWIARDGAGALVGVMGLRDARGGILWLGQGLLQDMLGKRIGGLFWRLMQLYRPGPETSDMVIDGLVVADPWRRQGVAAQLVAQGRAQANARGYPGLRAEVEAHNRAALSFYQAQGFQPCGAAMMGWPWARLYGRGRVQIMRLAADCPDRDRLVVPVER